MKSRLVGTRLGTLGLAARSWTSLRSISFDNPERSAAIANAIIADRLITQLPKDGYFFLDIGAHIGAIFSAAYLNNPTIRVIAIEADKSKAESLRRNFEYCDVFNFAIGELSGKASFYIHQEPGYNTLAKSEDRSSLDRVEVDIITLDELLSDAKVDIIKIDIEGAELGAFRGGINLLRRNRPIIMFESADLKENSLGYSAEKIWKFLDGEGYQIFTPDRVAHDAPYLGLETFLDAHAYPARTFNFFALPSEQRNFVRDSARQILGVKTPQ